MTITLNHTIIAARNRHESARFLTEMLGLPPHTNMGHFAAVQVGPTALDFRDAEGEIAQRHFAFQVSEEEFDGVFARIQERGLPYWADPFRKKAGEINRWDDGRGVYFDDPDGHLLEVITRTYGEAGLDAENPHPLLAREAT